MSTFVIPSEFRAIDSLTRPIKAMISAVKSFGMTADSSADRANRAFRKVKGTADSLYHSLNPLSKINSALSFAGISVGIAGATTLVGKFVQQARNVEDAEAAFTSLLGSVDNAKAMVKSLYDLGAKTPFQFADLQSAATTMIGFGAATQKDVIDKLNMLGDVAGGNAEKLNGIALAYSQIQAAGKASMQDVNQLINNGVPILAQLAKQWHMTTGAAREMVSKGKATGDEINRAFREMTAEGGMFYKAMDIASKTLSGQWSTFQDTLDQSFATIGQQLMPVAKEFVSDATKAAEKVAAWAVANKDLIKEKVSEWAGKLKDGLQWVIDNLPAIIMWTKVYIGALIALKVATIASTAATAATTVAQTAYNVVLGISTALAGRSAFYVMGNAVAYGAFRAAVIASTAAQWLFNAALNANPIGIIILGIIALAALVVSMIKHWDTWGKKVAMVLVPLGLVIDFAKTLYDNWNMVTEAFRKDGIIGALKAIGRVFLTVLLDPVEALLSAIGEITGADWANNAAANIRKLQNALVPPKDTWQNDAVKVAPDFLVNPKAQQAAMMERVVTQNNNTRQTVDINVNVRMRK